MHRSLSNGQVNRRDALVRVVEETMAQIQYELEHVNEQGVLNVAGLIFALK
jgi:hypothetical protein